MPEAETSDRMEPSKSAPLKAREGACAVGRSKLKDTDTISYAMDLNEANVQAIFNRCIAKEGTPEDQCCNSILFSRTLGYRPSDELLIRFDMEKMRMNKKSIEYLYGQLRCTHQKLGKLNLEEAYWNYQGKVWTNSKEHLLEFLHLGCTDGDEVHLISPFFAESNSANFDVPAPTLSPKDPAFPAWWETHKAEWEPDPLTTEHR